MAKRSSRETGDARERKVRVGRYRASGNGIGTIEKRVGRSAHTEATRRNCPYADKASNTDKPPTSRKM